MKPKLYESLELDFVPQNLECINVERTTFLTESMHLIKCYVDVEVTRKNASFDHEHGTYRLDEYVISPIEGTLLIPDLHEGHFEVEFQAKQLAARDYNELMNLCERWLDKNLQDVMEQLNIPNDKGGKMKRLTLSLLLLGLVGCGETPCKVPHESIYPNSYINVCIEGEPLVFPSDNEKGCIVWDNTWIDGLCYIYDWKDDGDMPLSL